MKGDKLKVQGEGTFGLPSQQAVLKEREIQKAEGSLSTLKKRAEQLQRSAMLSTGEYFIPEKMTLKFKKKSPEEAVLRLGDILGLMFGPERQSFELDIRVSGKSALGKPVKAAIQKFFEGHGIPSTAPKSLPSVSVVLAPSTYFKFVMDFQRNDSKKDGW